MRNLLGGGADAFPFWRAFLVVRSFPQGIEMAGCFGGGGGGGGLASALVARALLRGIWREVPRDPWRPRIVHDDGAAPEAGYSEAGTKGCGKLESFAATS